MSILNYLSVGVFKDYLRELPEPLFTKHLYQMIVDALSVCMSDDPQGNAKLIFSLLDCLSRINRVLTFFNPIVFSISVFMLN